MVVVRPRKPEPEPASRGGDGLVLPRELAVYRQDDWSDRRDYAAAKRQWLTDHGVDPADWPRVAPILRVSRRAHAMTVDDLSASDRLRVMDDPAAWFLLTGSPFGHGGRPPR
jgi:hypothetical protein